MLNLRAISLALYPIDHIKRQAESRLQRTRRLTARQHEEQSLAHLSLSLPQAHLFCQRLLILYKSTSEASA
jgi:hypothetical protein